MSKIKDVSKGIMKSLEIYASDVQRELEISTKEVSTKCVKELKQSSPRRKGGGQYAKGWTKKKQGTKYIVHNKTHYQLTHLLEFGHAIVDKNKRKLGGRTETRVHIRPAEQRAIKEFLGRIEKAIKK